MLAVASVGPELTFIASQSDNSSIQANPDCGINQEKVARSTFSIAANAVLSLEAAATTRFMMGTMASVLGQADSATTAATRRRGDQDRRSCPLPWSSSPKLPDDPQGQCELTIPAKSGREQHVRFRAGGQLLLLAQS